MSMRYKGSRLSATANTPTSLTASGAWTLQQQMQANGTSTWPFVRDPQFNYVTMLLHGDGSAGANNGSGGGVTPTVTAFNTDASTNNFNVTINGDARSDNFNPYQSGYYSNYFDGTGDYLTAPDNASLELGSSNFCMEGWFYPTDGTQRYLWAKGNGGLPGTAFDILLTTARTVTSTFYNGASSIATFTTSNTVTNNVWNHIAVVRNGSTFTCYINGTSGGTTSTASAIGDVSSGITIGTLPSVGSTFLGYVSNFRVVVGSAVYTGNFTPSTTPLTVITNTQLLTCQSNRFIDNSANAFAITANGDTKVAPAQPFTLPSSVATYGSGYFDGTGDSLSLASSSTALPTGTQDFSVEMYLYWQTQGGSYPQLISNPTTNGFQIYYDVASGLLAVGIFNVSNVITYTIAQTALAGAWTHLVVTRSGNTFRMFVNGVLRANGTNTISFASLTTQYIASDGSRPYTGYMTDVRTVLGAIPTGYQTSSTTNGTSVFTPPTAPLTAVSNTSLLTTQYNGGGNNSGFKDSSLNNFAITRNGNTTQGTFTPYGSNWSNYFDGSGDSLTAPSGACVSGTGDFTVECWIFPTVVPGTYNVIGCSDTSNGFTMFGLNANGTIFYGRSLVSVEGTTSNACTYNTWNHIAITRSSGTIKMFVNGVQGYSATSTYSYASGTVRLGTDGGGSALPYTGYISNFRIVQNTALYTSNFTPSTTPLTATTTTSLLTCQGNRFLDASSNNFTISKFGDTSVQRFSPFAPLTVYNPATNGGSAYFDGSGDYLSVANSASLQLLGGSFTLECWIYLTAAQANMGIVGIHDNTSAGYFIRLDTTIIRFYTSAATVDRTYSFAQNTWYHIAVSSSGTTGTLYINGVAQGATFSTNGAQDTTDPFLVGRTTVLTNYFSGYISDVRVVKGTALYTGTFTPPTAPLTPTASTSLLLSTTNSAILDQSMMNDLETVGNAQISTSVVKYGTASIAFDGTGDYLRPNSQLPFVFNTGDFTIEFWVYANSVSGWLTFFDNRPSTTGSGFFLGYNSGFQYYSGSSNLISGGTLSTSTWTHVALCRASGSVRIFVNGTQVGSTATDTSNYSTSTVLANGPFIGANYVPSDFLNGYLDDFRVTKYARYTTTFTPPTQALPNG